MHVRELSANDLEETMATYISKIKPIQISCLGNDARSFLKISFEAKYRFWLKVALEKT